MPDNLEQFTLTGLKLIYGEDVLDMLDLDLWDWMDFTEAKNHLINADYMLMCEEILGRVTPKTWEYFVSAIEAYVRTLEEALDEDE